VIEASDSALQVSANGVGPIDVASKRGEGVECLAGGLAGGYWLRALAKAL